MNASIMHLIWETRMKKFVVSLLFGIVAATNAIAQNFWQQTNGPYGGTIWALAIDSSGNIFAGTFESGIFRSNNNGGSWSPANTGLTNDDIRSLAVKASGEIFAGTFGGGVFRSTNNGNSWLAVNTGFTGLGSGSVYSFAFNASGHVFAGTGAGVFRSVNNGATWVPINTGLPSDNVDALVINANGQIFAGLFLRGIFRSTDNGGSWTQVLAENIHSLVINASGQIFAGTAGSGIFRSADNGNTWSQSNTGLTNLGVQALAIKAGGDIFAGTDGGGVFRSVNNGNSWTPVSTGLASMSIQALALNVAGDIFAGSSGVAAGNASLGVFRSTNNGGNWTLANTGLINTRIIALAINPSTQDIFAGTLRQGGLFRSTNGGNSWTLANTGLPNLDCNDLAISPTTQNVFAALDGFGSGVYRSGNNGDNWTQLNAGLTNVRVSVLAINASGQLFAGTDSRGVYRSLDNGANWSPANAGMTSTNVQAIAINPATQVIFAGTDPQGIYRSTDNGNSWTQVNNGLTNTVVAALAINSNGHIFAATEGGGVFRSMDNGGTWTPINTGLPSLFVYSLIINAAGHIFVGSANRGVFRSTDNGNTWTAINTGLEGVNVFPFAINPAGHLFAGTIGDGVFRSVQSTLAARNVLSLDSVDDHVAQVLPSVVKSQNITVSAWVKLNGMNAPQTIVAAQPRGDWFDGRGVVLSVNAANTASLNIGTADGSTESLNGSTKLKTEVWYHLAGTYDGSIMKIYLNGREEGSLMVSRPIVWDDRAAGNFPDPAQLYFGGQQDNSNTRGNAVANRFFLNGRLDEIRIWNIAQTQSEIQASIFKSSTGNEAGLAGYWNFDDGTANDLTNNRNNGILKDGAAIIPGEATFFPITFLSPRSIDFGAVVIGNNADRTVTLTNTGGANLDITGIGFAGIGNEFTILGGGNIASLAPLDSLKYTIRFSPQSAGNKNVALVIISNAASSPDTVALNGTGQPQTDQIIRTLVYHEITTMPASVDSRFPSPLLSDNGNRAIFSQPAATDGSPRIFIINADGSGQRELDPNNPPINLSNTPDISADGSRVVYPTNFRGPGITVVDVGAGPGSDTRRILATTPGGSTARARISGDGSTVVFPVANSDYRLPDNTPLQPGINAFDAAKGSHLRRVVGPEAIANLLGITVDRVFVGISTALNNLSVSHDGSRIAFAAFIAVTGGTGEMLFSVNLDGTGLVALLGMSLPGFGDAAAVGISADGNKVAYHTRSFATTVQEIGVVNFDGTGRRELVNSTTFRFPSAFFPFPEFMGSDQIELNFDGSKLLLGSTGALVDTQTGTMVQLAAGAAGTLVGDGLFRPTMNSSATRFLYIAGDVNNVRQLATLDINSPGLGQSPSVTNPMIDPSFILTNDRSTVTLSAKVGTSNTIIGVGGNFFLNGLNDDQVAVGDRGAPILLDNGTQGDVTAGDGIFTNGGRIRASRVTVVGPRTVRVKAEVRASDGKRHAIAVNFEPFSVLDQNPVAISLAPLSVDFGAVAIGGNADRTVTVTNTGSVNLTINSSRITGTNALDFTIISGAGPDTLAPSASKVMTVRFSPQSAGAKTAALVLTSNAASSPDTVRLSGTATSTQGIAQDSLALVDFYNSTNGANWINKTNWLSGQPVSTWFGVTVVGNRVTGLNLSANNLVGTLPASMGNLTNLSFLYLHANKLTGSIPREIDNLTNLTILYLYENQFNGPIPTVIGNLTKLRELLLQNNLFTGPIPKEIGNLINLTNLSLNNNQLTGSIPPEIGNLTSLTILWLHDNQLSGTLPAEIGRLANLGYLSLYTNRLTGAIPAAIGNLTNLTILHLYGNQLSGPIPTEIGNLTKLRELLLQGNLLTGLIPKEIGNLINLRTVYLNNNQFTGSIPPEIGNLTSLTILQLGNNKLTGAIPAVIGNLTNLTYLDFVNNQLTGAIPAAIGNLTNLTILYLYGNQLSGPIPTEIGNLTKLRELLLQNNQLTGTIPKEIGNLINLTNLSLNDNQLTGSIPPEIGNLTNLTILWLHNNKLNGVIPAEIGRLANLSYLSLYGTQLTGPIPTEIGNLANLTILYMYGNQLSGPIPAEIGNLTKLRELLLQNNLLTGPIPKEIGNLINLTNLSLNNNQLTGSIPPEIGNLTSLTILWLHDNQLSGTLPAEIGRLANLGYLSLYTNRLTGAIPRETSNLAKLRTLHLYKNRFSDLPNLSTIPPLSDLQVQNNQLTFEDIEPNIGVANFIYSPQDSVGAAQNIRSATGASLTLTVTVGGANNRYQWRKNGAPISGATNSSYTITAANLSDVGAYTCDITNTVATALTLRSRPINVSIFTLPPPVPQDTARAGQSLTLSINLPPGFQPTSRQLFYRQAGESSYQLSNLTGVGNNFAGTIPAGFVTIRGLEYYIRLSDGPTVVTFPASNPETNPAVIRVQVGRVNFPLAISAQTHRMISIPVLLSQAQIDSVLVDDFGEYNAIPRQWRLFRWQNEDYAEHPDIDSAFAPGAAFWLITRATTKFDVENARSVTSSQPFVITLQPGWNQIAAPFAFPVAWDSVRVIGGQIQERPQRWNGAAYEPNQTTLEPWEGYFIFNDNPAAVSLSVPNRESRGAPVEIIGKTAGLAANEFLLQIKMHGLKSGWKDEQNFVGMLANATNEADRFDFREAPPIGDHIRLSIMAQRHAYAGNFRAISTTGSFWDLRLSTTGGKENVRLTFSEQKKLPAGFQIWLLNTDRQSSLPISQGQVELEMAPKGATTNLRLIVGTPEFANDSNAGIPLIPYQFALRQNYPNPFNRSTERSRQSPGTKIEYELAERAEVKLEIFNLLGQCVRLLIDATQTAGAYTANWDGKDQRGNFANSGVYFYRLKAGDPSTGSGQGFVAVRKLVLSR